MSTRAGEQWTRFPHHSRKQIPQLPISLTQFTGIMIRSYFLTPRDFANITRTVERQIGFGHLWRNVLFWCDFGGWMWLRSWDAKTVGSIDAATLGEWGKVPTGTEG